MHDIPGTSVAMQGNLAVEKDGPKAAKLQKCSEKARICKRRIPSSRLLQSQHKAGRANHQVFVTFSLKLKIDPRAKEA